MCRPIPTEPVDRYHKGENVGAVPGAFGGKNWSPMEDLAKKAGLTYLAPREPALRPSPLIADLAKMKS
jgi:hypothetical protein